MTHDPNQKLAEEADRKQWTDGSPVDHEAGEAAK